MYNDNIDHLYTLLLQVIRMGKVTARNAELHKVQVKVADTCGAPLITDFLPVLSQRTVNDCEYDLPDIGQDVVVIFMPNGLETGFVLGGFYNTNQRPNQTNPDIYQHSFKDGTFLQYDRAAHVLTADVKGDIVVKATGNADITIDGNEKNTVGGNVDATVGGNLSATVTGDVTVASSAAVTIKASSAITLNAPTVNIQGTLNTSAQSGGSGVANITGTMKATGDITAGNISLQNHVHGGVETGGSNTSAPK